MVTMKINFLICLYNNSGLVDVFWNKTNKHYLNLVPKKIPSLKWLIKTDCTFVKIPIMHLDQINFHIYDNFSKFKTFLQQIQRNLCKNVIFISLIFFLNYGVI